MGLFKTLFVNWRDLITIIGTIFILYTGLAWIEHASAPTFDAAGNPSGGSAFLFDFAGVLKAVAAFALIVALPWLFIAMTFPNTLGKFVNDSFENGWREFGNDTADTKRLKLVLIVYVALLLSGALVWNGVLS